MKLSDAAASYVGYKQSMGMRFRTEANTLESLCRALGDVTLQEIQPERVYAYLAGSGPVTSFWRRKHDALKGFFRFAIARGYAASSPLPRTVPKPSQTFVPYIFSYPELRRLLDAVVANDKPCSSIDPDSYRTLLMLLYGAGLRISEALNLKLADVDLLAGTLHIRESKFYKSRQLPVGNDLLHLLKLHAGKRRREHAKPESPFFLSRRGGAVTRQAAEITFKRLRRRANVLRNDGNIRHQPRLHDLRHAFVAHRLVEWYRSGADVQRLLPQLSTYLGHGSVAATQRYLTLTPELLREANARFERYAMGAGHV
jgi:integrase/recombinase XerD